jgi:hypothetical protein
VGDTDLGYQTFLNGTRVSTIVVDTGQAVTNSIDHVGTDGGHVPNGTGKID